MKKSRYTPEQVDSGLLEAEGIATLITATRVTCSLKTDPVIMRVLWDGGRGGGRAGRRRWLLLFAATCY